MLVDENIDLMERKIINYEFDYELPWIIISLPGSYEPGSEINSLPARSL